MPSLRDQFAHFYTPDEDAIATSFKSGLIMPDTNVLLSLYRLQAGARDELFGAMEKLGDRLWIPYQVGLEFHRRRLDVMAKQEVYFTEVREELMSSVEGLRGKIRAFGARIGLGADRVEKIEDTLSELNGLMAHEVTGVQAINDVLVAGHTSDGILARIDALFEGRVGGPMEPKELEEARKEAERRVREKIPPGYKDKDKTDPTGDYLVWRQLMNEAAERKLPVVLITDDRKEDWYRREHGLTLGARYELREEMMREAGVPLLIMTTETFLLHAKKYLDAEVSPGTVDQAKELPFASHIQAVRDGGSVTADNLMLLTGAQQREIAALAGTLDKGQIGRVVRLLATATLNQTPEQAEAMRALLAHLLRASAADVPGEAGARLVADMLTSGQATTDDVNTVWLAWYLAELQRKQQPGEQAPPEE